MAQAAQLASRLQGWSLRLPAPRSSQGLFCALVLDS